MKCQQQRPFQQNSSLRALSKFPFTCNTNFGVYKCPPLVITLKGSCKLLCILCIVMYLMCCIVSYNDCITLWPPFLLQASEGGSHSLTETAAAVLPQTSSMQKESSFYNKLGSMSSMSELSSWFSNIGSKS